jgi:hypothetical protein
MGIFMVYTAAKAGARVYKRVYGDAYKSIKTAGGYGKRINRRMAKRMKRRFRKYI